MALTVSTQNPRYFQDAGGNIVYLTGSHTWNNFQDMGASDPPTPFDYDAYLDWMVGLNHNFIRMWVWEETKNNGTWLLSGWRFPNSAFARVSGQGDANDGKLKFDLSLFDQDYFDRLRSRIVAAGQHGIYVSIMLFEGWSIEDKGDSTVGTPFYYHPFNSDNNINSIDGDTDDDGEGEETHTLSISAITDIQKAYIAKVIDTVNDLDNVLYEIANESHDGSTAWQAEMTDYIKTYEAGEAKQHPIGMTFQTGGSNATLFATDADTVWVSPDATGGYDTAPPANDGTKVILLDTDHLGNNQTGDWVWKAFTRGYNPIYMDGYDLWPPLGEEANIRAYMGYTRTYADKMNLVAMTPQNALSETTYCLANVGYEYLFYQPGTGAFDINVTYRKYLYEWCNPTTGVIVESGSNHFGTQEVTPPFSGAAVLYLKEQ